jgi:predicted DNA-binding transcriptional regulator AlpA
MTTQESAPSALNTDQAARRLGVSSSLLEKLRVYTPEKSPPYIRIGRVIRYRTSDLDAWASARMEGGA